MSACVVLWASLPKSIVDDDDMYICMYVCMYCMYAYAYMYIYARTYIHIYMYIFVCGDAMCVCGCIYCRNDSNACEFIINFQ
jgi:hypothetical protein